MDLDLHDKLLYRENLKKLLSSNEYDDFLFERAHKTALESFGNKIYIMGITEFTNHCKNNCYFCGINKSNLNIERYRMTNKEILSCCRKGSSLGLNSFVLRGGEDGYYSNARIIEIIKLIKNEFPNCTLALSIGERSYETYRSFYTAGADMYFLSQETCTLEHYNRLHPDDMSLFNRLNCLRNLKKTGIGTGCGIIIGSPYQTTDNIIDDVLYMYDFNPKLISISPFVHSKDTIFKDKPNGSVKMTLRLIALMRILLPDVLLPVTNSLVTLDKSIREKAILAGANVLMPNLSPAKYRSKFSLYDNKICTGEETVENIAKLKKRMQKIGCELVYNINDYKD